VIPQYWLDFLHSNSLSKKSATIPEKADLSELNGGSLSFFSEERVIEEATDYYPGLAVSKFGYVPVASCALGSGDPYFINSNDGTGGPLYRIYHDAGWKDEDTYDTDEAVNIVLNSYTEVLQYVE